ncbi:MAG: PEP-CTERM sorting domain-containing protein [Planctomycetota bacterium]
MSQVSEPATVGLLGLGSLALISKRRVRKGSSKDWNPDQ